MKTNETAKVWRYFDQRKAVHLIKTSHLYLRRLDLLIDQYEGDPYEGTPTLAVFKQLKKAYIKVFGHASDSELAKQFEFERRATFVSCWQESEHESWLMWKQYCHRGGGFALQTTMKQICLIHAKLREQNDSLYLKSVQYLDHWKDDSLPHTVPAQVFVKPVWFSDEKELRFALFRGDCAWGGTEEQTEAALARLKDHELIPVNLTELVKRIVLNPLSTDEQKREIVHLVESERPELKAKLRDSDIAKKPVLSRFGKPCGR